MKRAIINVAIGEPYTEYQANMIESVKKFSPQINLITWTNELPPGSKSHADSMYGFKMYAFKYAFEQGYDSVLWLDSPTILKKDISYVFDIIEADKHGEFAIATEAKLYQYCNQKTVNYFNVSRQKMKDDEWLLNYGFIFGFTKDSETYKKMAYCESIGLFSTLADDYEDHMTNSNHLFNAEYVEHRHEESIISMIIQSEGRTLTESGVVHDNLTWHKYNHQ